MSLPFFPQPKPDRLAEAETLDRILERLDFDWARLIKARDKWICQICARKVTATIEFKAERAEADHYFCKSTYPALRHELDNGVTLCLKCHRAAQKDRSLIPEWIRERARACYRRVFNREPKEAIA